MALGGDGIGPEVVHAGLQILEQTAAKIGLKLEVEKDLLHGAAYDAYEVFSRDRAVEKARAAGVLTPDLGGTARTSDVTVTVIKFL